MKPLTPVVARKQKWGGRVQDEGTEWFLGRDDHGTWHGIHEGTELRLIDGRTVRHKASTVVLYAGIEEPCRAGWWRATFVAPDAELPFRVYVDMATPPEWADGVLSWTDLELDVVILADGSLLVKDQDVFEAAGFPAEIVEAAAGARDEVVSLLERNAEPFAATWRTWFGVLRGFRAHVASERRRVR